MAVVYNVVGAIFVIGLAGAVNALDWEAEYGTPVSFEEALSTGAGRIVAGWPAAAGQFPYQVNIRAVTDEGRVATCGGSVIHHHWVITAAHCVTPRRITFVVRFGVTDLTRPRLVYETTRPYVHPSYDVDDFNARTDDIALLGFDMAIPYGPYIQPCRLQSSQDKDKEYDGVRLTASGFGLTDDSWNGGTHSEILLWVFLRGITLAECRRYYSAPGLTASTTVCATHYNNTAQSICHGDSGGPLTEEGADGQPTMVGIASFTSTLGCGVWPSGYVRPGYYHEWYTQVTGINFDWTEEPQPEREAEVAQELIILK